MKRTKPQQTTTFPIETVTYTSRVKHVTLPENYTIVNGVIFDMNTGYRVGCMIFCSNKQTAGIKPNCECGESGECNNSGHLLLLPSE